LCSQKGGAESAKVKGEYALKAANRYMDDIDRALHSGGVPPVDLAKSLHLGASRLMQSADRALETYNKQKDKFNKLVEKVVTPKKEARVARLEAKYEKEALIDTPKIRETKATIYRIGEEISREVSACLRGINSKWAILRSV